MLDKLNFSNADLEILRKRKLSNGIESDIYLFNENGESKAVKIFKNNNTLNNKLKKIYLMNNRLKNCDYVVKAEKLVTYNNDIIGYSMPLVNGTDFSMLNYKKCERINILKNLSNHLKRLHKLGIVCADFHRNFMVDENNNIFLIDYDNFAIDDLYVDIENIYLQRYKKNIKHFDKNFDDYLMNLYTISIITKIETAYLFWNYEENRREFNFKSQEINQIVENTFNLKKFYNEELIINQINSKKDLKKINRKIF